MTHDEAELVRRAAKGDHAALVAVLRRRETRLYVMAVAILRSSWDAQDAVQETFLEACANLHTLREPNCFGAWLSTILVRKCLHVLRSTQKWTPVADIESRGEVFTGTRSDEEVLLAVSSLSEAQRIVIALRFYQDLSYADIERITGWPSGTVKSRMNRALNQLKAILRGRERLP